MVYLIFGLLCGILYTLIRIENKIRSDIMSDDMLQKIYSILSILAVLGFILGLILINNEKYFSVGFLLMVVTPTLFMLGKIMNNDF